MKESIDIFYLYFIEYKYIQIYGTFICVTFQALAKVRNLNCYTVVSNVAW